MAQLQGNDLAEWILGLPAVNPIGFLVMPIGTRIIHKTSETMLPDFFDHVDSVGKSVTKIYFKPTGWIQGDPIGVSELTEGWFLYPEPAAETGQGLPPAEQAGKVREFGGTWKTSGGLLLQD